jgi:hypothetical protein
MNQAIVDGCHQVGFIKKVTSAKEGYCSSASARRVNAKKG